MSMENISQTCTDYLNKCESEASKIIVLYLSMRESATIEQIASEVDFKRIELFPVIRSLLQKDVITKIENKYTLNK